MQPINPFSSLPGHRDIVAVDFPNLGKLNSDIWTGESSGGILDNKGIRFFSSSDYGKIPGAKVFIGFHAEVVNPDTSRFSFQQAKDLLMEERLGMIPLWKAIQKGTKGLSEFLEKGYLSNVRDAIRARNKPEKAAEKIDRAEGNFCVQIENLMRLFERQDSLPSNMKKRVPVAQRLGLINPLGLVAVAIPHEDGSRSLLTESIICEGESSKRQSTPIGKGIKKDLSSLIIRHHRNLVKQLPNFHSDSYPDLHFIAQSNQFVSGSVGTNYIGAEFFYNIPSSNEPPSYNRNTAVGNSAPQVDQNLLRFYVNDFFDYQSQAAGRAMGKEQNQDT